jgi:hypothetical protein
VHAVSLLNLCKLKRKSLLANISLVLLGLTGVPAAGFDLVIQSGVGAAGTSVQVPVSLSSGEASVAAVVFEVEYDFTKLEFQGGWAQGALAAPAKSGHTAALVEHSAPSGRIGIAAYDAEAPVAELPDGLLMTLQFAIRPTAEGFAAVRVSSVPLPDAADAEGRKVESKPSPGEATGVFITGPRADVVIAPASVSFGSVPSGHTEERVVGVSNLGTIAATLSAIRIEPTDAAFLLGVPPAMPRILQPGETLALPLRFSQFGEGSYGASLVIEQSDPTLLRLEAGLTATVVADGIFAYEARLLVPAVGRRSETNGWQSRSAAALFNPSDRTISLLLTLLHGAGAPLTREVRLAAGEMRIYDDLILDLFGHEQIGGAVIVSSSAPDVVVRSTVLREREGGNSAAHEIPIVDWSDLFHFTDTVYAAGVERSSGRRTTLSLVNLAAVPVTFEVELLGLGSGPAMRLYVVEPHQAIDGIAFLDEIGAGGGLGPWLGGPEADAPRAVLRIRALTPDALFFAHIETVDPLSGATILQAAR